MKEYFDDAPLEDEALFCRYFFARAAYYEHFSSRLPNIPEGEISGAAPLTRIEKRLEEFQSRHAKRMIRYYDKINE